MSIKANVIPHQAINHYSLHYNQQTIHLVAQSTLARKQSTLAGKQSTLIPQSAFGMKLPNYDHVAMMQLKFSSKTRLLELRTI